MNRTRRILSMSAVAVTWPLFAGLPGTAAAVELPPGEPEVVSQAEEDFGSQPLDRVTQPIRDGDGHILVGETVALFSEQLADAGVEGETHRSAVESVRAGLQLAAAEEDGAPESAAVSALCYASGGASWTRSRIFIFPIFQNFQMYTVTTCTNTTPIACSTHGLVLNGGPPAFHGVGIYNDIAGGCFTDTTLVLAGLRPTTYTYVFTVTGSNGAVAWSLPRTRAIT